jgi:hypothetical protein
VGFNFIRKILGRKELADVSCPEIGVEIELHLAV